MCGEQRLMHQWGKVSWLKLSEWKKGRGKPKIKLVELVKNDMSIKEATEYNYGYDRMAKKNTCGWPWLVCWESMTLISLLRIHNQTQSFGIEVRLSQDCNFKEDIWFDQGQ